MAEQIIQETIRKTAGSGAPAAFVFSNRMRAYMVDNLDASDGVFCKKDATFAAIGSDCFYVPANQFRTFDVSVGSVFIEGSGGSTPECQVLSLG